MQTEPTTTQSTADPAPAEAAPQTWQDIIRQHIPGPVFSLTFHIIVLILLGTIVVIVPNAGKDDTVPVQISQLEPVLPPPEEEPTPSDMTVMDTSNPSLDRYESSFQQMEDVGVTDVEIMTDIDIPTALTIPDSNSALKLQGVLPFGRKGGGEMGDGGEGDGRGNTKGLLQGVFYDLKQTRDRHTSDEFAGVPNGDWVAQRVPPTMKIMQSFVNGAWRREYDAQGGVHYPVLDKYYRAKTRLWTSLFYTDEEIEARDAPWYFECDNEVSPAAWVIIYSGHVVAPFTGKFRFLGTADDVILVRFNKEIVLDYGFASFSAKSFFYTMRTQGGGADTSVIPDGVSELARLKETSENSIRRRSPLYSAHPLEVYPTSAGDSNPAHSLGKGSVITVREGEVYPIEVLISEIPGGSFFQALFIERLDDNGKPLEPNSQEYVLFRTTLDPPVKISSLPKPNRPPQGGGMPGMPWGGGGPGQQPRSKYKLPGYKPYGPIWRVVPSTASSAGGAYGSGTGSGSQSLLGNRTTPRTARVNENDDDLSL